MMSEDRYRIGSFELTSRLFLGTGKYRNHDLMVAALGASGCQVVTVAVRRDVLSPEGETKPDNILDHLDLDRYTVLPNTAGCFTAKDAVRSAKLSRELLEGLNNPGAKWVKIEVLADKKTLLPDPVGTLEATKELVGAGFEVLAYTNDDPILAKRLKDAGAISVMPLGSPIGCGQGILNPNNIRLCLEYLKEDDPDYPVIVDAGVGTASDVAIAMELGADGVLLNTGIAGAREPVRMAGAMAHAIQAGRLAFLSGRIPRKRYATASSPVNGVIAPSAQPV
jgi:thiazole synthase